MTKPYRSFKKSYDLPLDLLQYQRENSAKYSKFWKAFYFVVDEFRKLFIAVALLGDY